MLRKLIDHLRWADARLLDSLRNTDEPPAKALELYAHIIGAEHVWLARLEGRVADVAVWPVLDVDGCAALAKQTAESLAAFVALSTDETLQRTVHYRNSAGVEFDSTVEDILLHVAMHGQYHRGQVNLLLRDAGLQPAPVDYIAFVRGTPAATRR